MNTLALTRPAAPRKLRITLAARQAAVATARHEVRAAIRAWKIPVDPALAVLLTSELVANALAYEAGNAIEVVVSCAHRQLQVDVYDTSPATALQADAGAGVVPAGMALQAGAGPAGGAALLAALSSSWGYRQIPTGRAGYFTLAF